MILVCAHVPTYSTTGAFGFSFVTSATRRPDCVHESRTILSVRLHQIWSGTQEAAMARVHAIGLRSAYAAAADAGVPPTSRRASHCSLSPFGPPHDRRHAA